MKIKARIFCLISAIISFHLLLPSHSWTESLKKNKYKFVEDVNESMISPTGEYALFIDRRMIFGKRDINNVLYFVNIAGNISHESGIKEYIHSIEISPSGEFIVIGTMNDSIPGNPTKGKMFCYDKKGNNKWEKDIWGKPYLSKDSIFINEYKKHTVDPITEEYSFTPGRIRILNYEGKELFKTNKIAKIAAISQDGNYFVTSYQGKTSLYHVSGKLLWMQNIEGYVSLSQDGSFICIGERKVDKKDTIKVQRIQCLTKEGKTIWTDKMKTRYGIKLVLSLTGEYLAAYPSGIEPFEGGAYYSDKKEVVVYDKKGKQLWTYKEPVKNMGSFKYISIFKDGTVAIFSEEFLTEKVRVEKNDWVYFFDNKGKMLWKTNKIGKNISLSADGQYLVTGPYFYETQK